MLSKLFMKQGKYEDSIAVVQKGIKIKSDNPVLFLFLGQAYIANEQFDQAIYVLKKALSLNPDMDMAKIQISKAYISNGNCDKAKKLLHELSMGTRNLEEVHFMLADIYAKEDKYDQSVAEYEAALLHAEEITKKHPEILNIQDLNCGPEEKTKTYQKAVSEIKLEIEESTKKSDSSDSNLND